MHLDFNAKFRCLVNPPMQLKWRVLSYNLWPQDCLHGTEQPPAPAPCAAAPLHCLGTHSPPLPLLDFLCFGWICMLWWQDYFASADERESECSRRFTGIGIKWHTNLKLTMTVFVQSLKKPTQIIWELEMNVSEHFHSHRTILASCQLHILQKHLLLAQGKATTECSTHYWHYSPTVYGCLISGERFFSKQFSVKPWPSSYLVSLWLSPHRMSQSLKICSFNGWKDKSKSIVTFILQVEIY